MKTIKHKFLTDIGVFSTPWNIYRDRGTFHPLKLAYIGQYRRQIKYLFYQRKFGVWKPETWNLDSTSMMWLYERLMQYKIDSMTDLTEQTVETQYGTMTVDDVINEMLEIAEYCLANPNDATEEAKERFKNNKYIQTLPKYNDWVPECIETEKKFWILWAAIFHFVWW